MTKKELKQMLARLDKADALLDEIRSYIGLVGDALAEQEEAEIAQTKPPLPVNKKAAKKK